MIKFIIFLLYIEKTDSSVFQQKMLLSIGVLVNKFYGHTHLKGVEILQIFFCLLSNIIKLTIFLLQTQIFTYCTDMYASM